jgi:hypothetical protein
MTAMVPEIQFERTRDYDLIKSIMINPRIWPWISDDATPLPADFRPIESEAVYYILVHAQDRLLGMWMFVPQNAICWEVHTCILPGHGFDTVRYAAHAMARWIWQNTPCQRLITSIPRYNRSAYSLAVDAGMQEWGVNEAAYLKNGRLHDLVMLGMSKPMEEVCQPQQ